MPGYETPEVSVVIPSRAGPTLERAVASALAQQDVAVEVIVVVNGAFRAVSFEDPRVRVLESDARLRGNGARAAGIAAARAVFIAMLDDDDYWHPEKLRRQLVVARAQADGGRLAVVGCGLEERRPDGTAIRVSPRRPLPIVNVRDYLFRRPRLFSDLPQLQTSTLLFSAELGRLVPFDPSLTYHQDWSWLLAADAAGARFVQVDLPLTYREITGSESVGGRISWDQSVEWAYSNIIDDRLLGDFILMMALPKAIRRNDVAGVKAVFETAAFHRPGRAARTHAAISVARWRTRRLIARLRSASIPKARKSEDAIS